MSIKKLPLLFDKSFQIREASVKRLRKRSFLLSYWQSWLIYMLMGKHRKKYAAKLLGREAIHTTSMLHVQSYKSTTKVKLY